MLADKMKLVPLQGIDELRFGDDIAKAVAVFGDADEKRSHADDRCRTTLHFVKQDLTLGFGADDRLTFIAAHLGEQEVELWGERPMDLAQGGSDSVSVLRRWLEHRGNHATPHQDCFGATLEVREEGLTFCFSKDDPPRLEGIQLSSA
jgi:hypothetical protein